MTGRMTTPCGNPYCRIGCPEPGCPNRTPLHPPDCPCQQGKPHGAVTPAEVESCARCVEWAADLYRQGRKNEWADYRVVHAVLHRDQP